MWRHCIAGLLSRGSHRITVRSKGEQKELNVKIVPFPGGNFSAVKWVIERVCGDSPASLTELIAFGATFPGVQKSKTIFAIGEPPLRTEAGALLYPNLTCNPTGWPIVASRGLYMSPEVMDDEEVNILVICNN